MKKRIKAQRDKNNKETGQQKMQNNYQEGWLEEDGDEEDCSRRPSHLSGDENVRVQFTFRR